MRSHNCHYLGHISKTVGTDGGLSVFFKKGLAFDHTELESVFIMIDGKLVPFFIEDISMRAKDDQAVIWLEDIDSIEKARELCGHDIYIDRRLLAGQADIYHSFTGIIGYGVYHSGDKYIGKVQDIIEHPGNPLISIDAVGREILIPVAGEIILDVDHENGVIRIDPPDGLLDLNA